MGLLGSIVKVGLKVGGGLLKRTPIGTLATVAGLAVSAAGAAVRSARRAPALPPLSNVTGGGTGNVAYGGNIRAAAEARGMSLRGTFRARRMNPANSKAIRRAIRRITSGEKLFKALYKVRHGHAAVGVTPKFTRKKRT